MEELFELAKKVMLKEYSDFYLQKSTVQALESFETLIISNSYDNGELKKTMEAYTYEMFRQQLKTMLRNAHFVWLVTGNITPQDSIDLVEKVS